MKLMLRGYSQDVDFLNQKGPIENYLVFENEETKELIRIAVPWETIIELAKAAGIGVEDVAETAPEEPEEEPEEMAEEGPEPEEETDEEQEARHAEELARMRLERDGHDPDSLPPRPKKRMPQPPAPHVYGSVRERIRTPTSEDDVPSV